MIPSVWLSWHNFCFSDTQSGDLGALSALAWISTLCEQVDKHDVR